MMRQSLLVVLAALGFAVRLPAGSVEADPKAAVSPGRTNDMATAFQTGAVELQVALGAQVSVQDTSALRPNIDYGDAVVRVGYMLDTARGSGILRGNDEVMIEAIGGPIYTGPGTALGGVTVIYRRNFVPASARLIPYLNLGVGGIYSDAYHQRFQRALGSPFEFDLLAGVGLRFRLGPHWSVDAETSFRHLSNADFASRNYGTNAPGGLIGLSYSF